MGRDIGIGVIVAVISAGVLWLLDKVWDVVDVGALLYNFLASMRGWEGEMSFAVVLSVFGLAIVAPAALVSLFREDGTDTIVFGIMTAIFLGIIWLGYARNGVALHPFGWGED